MRTLIILVATGLVTLLFAGCEYTPSYPFDVGLEFRDRSTGTLIVPDTEGLYIVEVGQNFSAKVIWTDTAGPSVPPSLEGIRTETTNSVDGNVYPPTSPHPLITWDDGANWTASAVGLDSMFVLARWNANGQGIGTTYQFKAVNPPGP